MADDFDAVRKLAEQKIAWATEMLTVRPTWEDDDETILARAVLDLLRYRQAVMEALEEESQGWAHLEGPAQAIAAVRAAIASKLEAGRG